jgi:hypothetical protein
MEEKKFFIRGYRKKVDFATFYDPEPYSLKEAIDKVDEYFRKIRRLGKIMLFEHEKADGNIAVISMKKWRGFLDYFNRSKGHNG